MTNTRGQRERERGGGGGGVGRRANCLLGATTGTGEGGLWRILGARERHTHQHTHTRRSRSGEKMERGEEEEGGVWSGRMRRH